MSTTRTVKWCARHNRAKNPLLLRPAPTTVRSLWATNFPPQTLRTIPVASRKPLKRLRKSSTTKFRETTKTEIVEGGRIKRLSVAVLVDGRYEKAADGNLSYSPRPQEELDQIAALVRSAVGFDKERGDQVHVTNLRFADTGLPQPAEDAEGGIFDLSKKDYFHIAELSVVALVSLLVLLFVVRPLVRRIVTPGGRSVDRRPRAGMERPGDGRNRCRRTMPPARNKCCWRDHRTAHPRAALRKAKILGEVQAATLREVGEIVENNKEEAVTIVRNWIQAA